jgi:hypothetical protein
MKGAVPDGNSAAKRIRDNAQALFREREPFLPDKQAKLSTACCCLVLAAYREMRGQLAELEAFELVRTVMFRTFQKPMRFFTRLWLWLSRDPLKRLRGQRWKNFSQRMYGASLEFDQEETENSVDLLVRRCGFHQFFREQGEPALTRVFCGWDRNWMDIVDRSGRSVRTERPSTISTGGDCCRFRLVRTEEEMPKQPNDIILLELSRLKTKTLQGPRETAT